MDDIFAAFIPKDEDTKEVTSKRIGYMRWFCDVFPLGEFEKEEYLFRSFLEYCGKLEIVPKFKYLSVFLELELRSILVRTKTRVIGTEAISFEDPVGFETALETTKGVIIDIYRELDEQNYELDDFIVSADVFMNRRLNERLGDILTQTYEMASISREDAADFVLENVSALKYIYDRSQLEELTGERVEDKNVYEKVCDSGIPFIDQDLGGIFRTQLGGVEAQPGTGKTRFVLGTYAYRAITLEGRNVLFNALEQEKKEIEAIMVALHCFTLFRIQIDSRIILRDIVPVKLKDKVETARLDLFESGKYGKLYINAELMYLENFIQRIITLDRLHGPFDLIVIDYMGLMEQLPIDDNSNKYRVVLKDYQIIGRAFRQYKRFARARRKACIAISQLNGGGITAGERDEDIDTTMAQGGIEVYRNTDWNIAITMTPEMKAQQVRRFSQPKVRDSAGFGRQLCDTRLAFAYFYPKVQTKV